VGADVTVRVLLADDQTLVRQGLARLLGLVPDLLVVGEAADGAELLALVAETEPDVLLVDVRMPRLDGLGVLRALGGRRPVVLLTTFDDPDLAAEAAQLGARGFLLKDADLDTLADALRVAAAGGSTLRPVAPRVVVPERTFRAAAAPDPLTARERDVLRLMAAGSSNREIARALGTAEGTVKNQASSILLKLGVRDRTRAVLRALELGWI
jgi:DNA-binding NarL/FixJ family response regulator